MVATSSRSEASGTIPEIVEADLPSAMRSPADVLRAIVAATVLLGVVLVQVLLGDSVIEFPNDFLRGFDALAATLVTVLAASARVLAIVFLAGGFVVALLRGRWRLLFTAVAAALLADLLFALVDASAPDP